MSISQKQLQTIEHLYLLEMDLAQLADEALINAEERKQARSKLKEFRALLKIADPDYMGGEDVLDSLKTLEAEVAEKVR